MQEVSTELLLSVYLCVYIYMSKRKVCQEEQTLVVVLKAMRYTLKALG